MTCITENKTIIIKYLNPLLTDVSLKDHQICISIKAKLLWDFFAFYVFLTTLHQALSDIKANEIPKYTPYYI